MPTIRLTQVAVDRLKAPAAGRVEYWDNQLPSFGLRVSQSGRKTWQVMYRVNGELRREKLGTLAEIPKVEVARDRARASMEQAQRGIDPVAVRQRAAEAERAEEAAEEARRRDTVGAVIDRYLARSEGRVRPGYYRETKRALQREVMNHPLGKKPIDEVIRRDVRELIEGIAARGSPIMANRVLAYIRAMFSWAVANDLIETNPCQGLKALASEVERDRALSDTEIRLFWLACDDIGWPFGPMFKLLLLTAQRRDEVAQARYAEIDGTAWTIPKERAKNGKAHIVHLTPLACDIIAAVPQIGTEGLLFTTTGDTPVSGFSKAMNELRAAMLDRHKRELAEEGRDAAAIERAAIAHFTVHDLRRSAATGMAALGIAHHVVDKILNHVAGAIRGVAAVYNRFEYLDERKAALAAWSRHIENLVKPPAPNVVRLPAKAH